MRELPDASVDLTWSLESGEHMPNKAQFVSELARVTAPGGRVIVATWCHRDLEDGEVDLKPKEQKLLAVSEERKMEEAWMETRGWLKGLSVLRALAHPFLFSPPLSPPQRINKAYYLPPWCSGADYEALFKAAGLTDIRRDDWSASVAPFWGAVIRSALSVRGVRGLLGAGWKTIKVRKG